MKANPVCTIWALFLSFLFLSPSQSLGEDIIYTNHEIIRNGDFESGDAWYRHYGVNRSTLVEMEGEYGMTIPGEYYDTYAFQLLPLPSTLNSATLQFFSMSEDEINISTKGNSKLSFSIATSSGFDTSTRLPDSSPPLDYLGVINEQIIDSVYDWQSTTITLNSQLIAAINGATGNGLMAFLVISYTKTGDYHDHDYAVNLDNLSLKISGTRESPDFQGKIAYFELDEDDEPKTIKLLDPNTRSTSTVWTHPGDPYFNWHGLSWRGDSSEIAFVSDHEMLSSPFLADIYAVRPDGTGMRKVTNAPSQEEICELNPPRVTVRGEVSNLSGDYSAGNNFMILGVQYADAGDAVVLNAGVGEVIPFEVHNVPVLSGNDTFNHWITIFYSNESCASGVFYKLANGMIENGVVDIGTINFVAVTCLSMSFNLPRGLSWSWDGSEIGFHMLGLKKVSSGASNSFNWVELEPGNASANSNMSWSPVDDRYLYRKWGLSLRTQVHLAEEGGTAEVLVERDVESIQAAWMPDGSGFVYVADAGHILIDPNIMYYNFADRTITRLTWFRGARIKNVTVSPDGRYVSAPGEAWRFFQGALL